MKNTDFSQILDKLQNFWFPVFKSDFGSSPAKIILPEQGKSEAFIENVKNFSDFCTAIESLYTNNVGFKQQHAHLAVMFFQKALEYFKLSVEVKPEENQDKFIEQAATKLKSLSKIAVADRISTSIEEKCNADFLSIYTELLKYRAELKQKEQISQFSKNIDEQVIKVLRENRDKFNAGTSEHSAFDNAITEIKALKNISLENDLQGKSVAEVVVDRKKSMVDVIEKHLINNPDLGEKASTIRKIGRAIINTIMSIIVAPVLIRWGTGRSPWLKLDAPVKPKFIKKVEAVKNNLKPKL